MSTSPRPDQSDTPQGEALHPAYEQVRSVLRASLEQPDAAPVEVRDAALAAALAEAAVLNPEVPSLTARRSIRLEGSQRWMAAAAGLVVLFGLGTVARQIGDTSGSGGSASRVLSAANGAAVTAAPVADASTPSEAALSTLAPGAIAHGLGTIPPGNTVVVGTAAPGVSTAAGSLLGVATAADLTTVPDLFAPVVTDTVAGQVSTRPDTGCVLQAGEVVVAQVNFAGTPAWVVRDASTGSARALALDCHELAHTP
jgi:hypothetical protein